MSLVRRDFIKAALAVGCAGAVLEKQAMAASHVDVAGLLGVTTGSFGRHLSETAQPGKMTLLELPAWMRDDLDMPVLDLMTANVPSLAPAYLSRLRKSAEQAGCIITNLKMNQPGLNMGSADRDTRQHAVEVYKKTIDAAEHLGCRWVRPLPTSDAPNWDAYVQSYRELIEYAADKKITLLIENFGWIEDQPEAIPRVIEAVGEGLDASVDTGNWTDQARYAGLEKAFPLAVTCDFKAKALGPEGEHVAYDLQRCFQIGWEAGFRGPYCFEHTHGSLAMLLKDLKLLRDMLRGWMEAASVKSTLRR